MYKRTIYTVICCNHNFKWRVAARAYYVIPVTWQGRGYYVLHYVSNRMTCLCAQFEGLEDSL
jgi:hypothetical protein